MRNQVAEVARSPRLMNQVSITERDFNFAERIARVVSIDVLTGLHVAVRLFDPIGIGRHPFRIPDDLRGAAHADGDWKLTLADADLIGLHFLAVLPKGQTKRRH